MKFIFEGFVFFGAMAALAGLLVIISAANDPMWHSWVR
jgi:hypothetical protein|tara:strand:+ start:641 stop:754 length:114 start_codon:yes stop_codon:yes gene_type:complete